MRVTEKGQVTIPKEIRDRLNIGPGSEVDFVAVDDGVRQHEQKVAGARRPIAEIGRHHLLDQRANLRPAAGKRGDGDEQWVKEGRSHS
mgnify:CR=1 FL=1